MNEKEDIERDIEKERNGRGRYIAIKACSEVS